jgi:hypothetical protein
VGRTSVPFNLNRRRGVAKERVSKKKVASESVVEGVVEDRFVVPVVVDEVEEMPVKVGVKLRGFRGVRKAVRRRSRTGV